MGHKPFVGFAKSAVPKSVLALPRLIGGLTTPIAAEAGFDLSAVVAKAIQSVQEWIFGIWSFHRTPPVLVSLRPP